MSDPDTVTIEVKGGHDFKVHLFNCHMRLSTEGWGWTDETPSELCIRNAAVIKTEEYEKLKSRPSTTVFKMTIYQLICFLEGAAIMWLLLR